jgi:hypothetical protein
MHWVDAGRQVRLRARFHTGRDDVRRRIGRDRCVGRLDELVH